MSRVELCRDQVCSARRNLTEGADTTASSPATHRFIGEDDDLAGIDSRLVRFDAAASARADASGALA